MRTGKEKTISSKHNNNKINNNVKNINNDIILQS